MAVCKENLLKLFTTTRELIAKETSFAIESLSLIGELDRLNAALTLEIPAC